MRLFIGIKTGCESYLSSLQNELKEKGTGSFTDPANLHITLRFIGEAPIISLRDICEAISELDETSFELECRGIIVFKRSGTVSAEVGGDVKILASIFSRLEKSLAKRGFEKVKREFSPHVTLARNYCASVKSDLGSIPHSSCRFKVEEIILFDSRQTTGKNVYVPIFVKKLEDGSA